MLSKINVAIVTPSLKFKYKKYWIFVQSFLDQKFWIPNLYCISILIQIELAMFHPSISLIFSLCFPSPLSESHRLRWGHMTWSRPCGRRTGRPRSSPSNRINQSAVLNPFSVCVWSAVCCSMLSLSAPYCHLQLLVSKTKKRRWQQVSRTGRFCFLHLCTYSKFHVWLLTPKCPCC